MYTYLCTYVLSSEAEISKTSEIFQLELRWERWELQLRSDRGEGAGPTMTGGPLRDGDGTLRKGWENGGWMVVDWWLKGKMMENHRKIGHP